MAVLSTGPGRRLTNKPVMTTYRHYGRRPVMSADESGQCKFTASPLGAAV